jgi:hypothetical protein
LADDDECVFHCALLQFSTANTTIECWVRALQFFILPGLLTRFRPVPRDGCPPLARLRPAVDHEPVLWQQGRQGNQGPSDAGGKLCPRLKPIYAGPFCPFSTMDRVTCISTRSRLHSGHRSRRRPGLGTHSSGTQHGGTRTLRLCIWATALRPKVPAISLNTLPEAETQPPR